MKKLIAILTLIALTVAFAETQNTSSVEVQYLKDENKPIGAILREGVLPFTDKDGHKAYWITGKALVELQKELSR